MAEQQPASFVQHFMPLSQQPSLLAAWQQALSLAQQASVAWQQSAAFCSALPGPVTNTATEKTNVPKRLENISTSIIEWLFENHNAGFGGAQRVNSARHNGGLAANKGSMEK